MQWDKSTYKVIERQLNCSDYYHWCSVACEAVHVPKILIIPTDLPIPFKPLQFPVETSFALRINKSQGQTFNLVGVDLRKECFTHGGLYVGLS